MARSKSCVVLSFFVVVLAGTVAFAQDGATEDNQGRAAQEARDARVSGEDSVRRATVRKKRKRVQRPRRRVRVAPCRQEWVFAGGKFGYEGSVLFSQSTEPEVEPMHLGYGVLGFGWERECRRTARRAPGVFDNLNFDVELRARTGYDGRGDFDIRTLMFSQSADWYRLRVGWQQIAWGETFGSQVLDVVNPRDLSDPFRRDLSWIRRSIPAVNTQFFLGKASLQGVYVPWPESPRLAPKGSIFDPLRGTLPPGVEVAPYDKPPLGGGAEGGARLSYLFDFGLDVALLHYSSGQRMPVYDMEIRDMRPVLVPVDTRVALSGLSYSYSRGSLVIRGDHAFIDGQAVPSRTGLIVKEQVMQSVLGVDAQVGDSFHVGVQYHRDDYSDEARDSLSWLVRVVPPSSSFELDLMLFHGLNHSDLWFQSKLSWSMTGSLEFFLSHDVFDGKANDRLSAIAFFRGMNRTFSGLEVSF